MVDEPDLDPVGSDRAVYVISVASELTGVHPQTLRAWDRRGLVSPARTGGMSRRYSANDVARIRKVHDLTTQGLTLAGVSRILTLEEDMDALRNQIHHLQAALATALSVPQLPQSNAVALVPLRQDLVRWRGPGPAGWPRNTVRASPQN